MKLPFPSRPLPGGSKPPGQPSSTRRQRPFVLMLTALLGCATTALGQIPQAAFSFQSKLALTNAAFAVEVAGNLAYVADSSPRLNVIDVSNPAAPKIVGGIATGATVRDIFVDGNLAYVAASTDPKASKPWALPKHLLPPCSAMARPRTPSGWRNRSLRSAAVDPDPSIPPPSGSSATWASTTGQPGARRKESSSTRR